MDISNLSLRQLQKESARALIVLQATNENLMQFNNKAHHNSKNWYIAVIEWYVSVYGDLPSLIGPASKIRLIYDV